MSDLTATENQRAAAEYLRQLLLKPGHYLAAWQRHAARPREGVINQMAVAEVVADHLRRLPGRTGDREIMPYQLRDVISGALAGTQLSEQTLRLFAEAFGFSAHEVERLMRLRAGSTKIRVLSGSHAVPAEAEEDVDRVVGPRLHRTVSLHDHVYVGADARIDRARTLQVVEATVGGLDRIPFLSDTNVLTLEVGQGGKELTDGVRHIGNSVFFTEILLARTLDLSETLTLEYWITYRYPGDENDPGEREFRRAVIRHIDNFDIRVEFHPDCIPKQVWWAQWDGIDGAVLARESISLDSQCSAHRYLRSLENTVAGFYWEWDQAR